MMRYGRGEEGRRSEDGMGGSSKMGMRAGAGGESGAGMCGGVGGGSSRAGEEASRRQLEHVAETEETEYAARMLLPCACLPMLSPLARQRADSLSLTGPCLSRMGVCLSAI